MPFLSLKKLYQLRSRRKDTSMTERRSSSCRRAVQRRATSLMAAHSRAALSATVNDICVCVCVPQDLESCFSCIFLLAQSPSIFSFLPDSTHKTLFFFLLSLLLTLPLYHLHKFRQWSVCNALLRVHQTSLRCVQNFSPRRTKKKKKNRNWGARVTDKMTNPCRKCGSMKQLPGSRRNAK